MTDPSLELLYRRIESDKADKALLLADEHCLSEPTFKLPVVTNRVDVAQRFAAGGHQVVTGDFDLSGFAPECVYYRVSKEKPLVHYLLNEALARLPLGGRLVLTGEKGDGLKTYADKARQVVGSPKQQSKGAGGALLADIEKCREPDQRLDDSNYTALINIAPHDHPELYSKPGVYGWKKIDRGSALLIEGLDSLAGLAPQSVLDLGCGYGYLTVMAHVRFPEACFTATDNNATALLACEKNVTTHTIQGKVVGADCADTLTDKVDLLLCNPPFHKGFDIHGDLTRCFLGAAARLLNPQGRALFVVNQFIALEQKAEGLFSRRRLLLEREGFRVFELML